MTVFLKNNAVGLDKEINQKMKEIDYELSSFGLYIYGRLYNADGNPIAHLSNGDYEQIFLNDNQNTCAFIVSEKETQKSQNKLMNVQIDVVFSLDISKIIESEEYEDEKIKIMAIRAVNSVKWNVKEVKKTIPVVFHGFDLANINRRDVYPYFNFSLQCDVFYNFNSDCLI